MLPVIFGISDIILTKNEISLLSKSSIWGIILFARNIDSKAQTETLTQNIKKYSKNKKIKILIDEEGGRISRLQKIYPARLKSAMQLGEILQSSKTAGKKAIIDVYTEIAHRLKLLSIDIACSPVADLTMAETHDIIGDRAFSDNVDIVVEATKIAADTLLDNNILPVIKHIPGHGRANCDSHLELPRVTTDLDILQKTDFAVFKQLNSYPLAMTAHIIYDALDKNTAITLSKKAITYIKNDLGYKGKIMTDDINMKALSQYSLSKITRLSLEAGCDYILHCNGKYEEMDEIINTIRNEK